MKSFILLFISAIAISQTNSARILGIIAFSGKSHNSGFGALTATLARKGHDVTVITPYPIQNPPERYRIIDAALTRSAFEINFSQEEYVKKNLLQKINCLWFTAAEVCPQLLEIPEVKALLKEKFDLVIVSMFFNDCFLPFAHHNKAPLILYSPVSIFSWASVNMGIPEPSSYVPSIFLPYSDKMTFTQRAINTALSFYLQILHNHIFLPSADRFARGYFGKNTPSILEIESNTSLALINNHVSLNYPRPLNPNVIEVGGLHIEQANEPLPKDLREFMEGAKDGVIYFSMGSLVKLENFPEMISNIVETFKPLPQRVIWKLSLDQLPGNPSNIKISKWLPQEAILAHPKTRLFITHGGLLSTQEAVYHGVPLVGIPVFGDQQLNVRQAELLGFAVGLDFHNVTKESLSSAIHKVINNHDYETKARVLMKRVRDQPETPLERAVFWTEYVLRHDGAAHLRSAATQLAWYQLYLVDVVLAGFMFIVLVAFLLKKCFNLCFKSQTGTEFNGNESKKEQ